MKAITREQYSSVDEAKFLKKGRNLSQRDIGSFRVGRNMSQHHVWSFHHLEKCVLVSTKIFEMGEICPSVHHR